MHGSRRSSAWPHNFFKSFPLVCRRAFQIFSLFHWFAGVHSKFWEPLPYCIGFQSGAAPSSIISWHFQIKPTLAAISVNADATENMCLFVHNNRNHIMESFRRMPLWHQPMSKIHLFPKHFLQSSYHWYSAALDLSTLTAGGSSHNKRVADLPWSKTGCVWPPGPRFCITFGGKTGTHAKPRWNLTVLVFGLSIFFDHVGLVEHVQIRSFSSASLEILKVHFE